VRLLVFGNRDWTCRDTIAAWLAPFHTQWQKRGGEAPLLIHGACGKRDSSGRAYRGADELAHDVAFDLGWRIQACPADWSLGDKAGPVRNADMAARWLPTRALGFGALERRGDDTGTFDMFKVLNRMGVLVTVVPRPGVRP
jgi:hypothetical protein